MQVHSYVTTVVGVFYSFTAGAPVRKPFNSGTTASIFIFPLMALHQQARSQVLRFGGQNKFKGGRFLFLLHV